MPTVIAYHDIVKDTERWLSSPKREEVFGPLGVTNIRTFVDPQDPHRVGLVMDIADLDAVMAAMASPAVAEAIVIGEVFGRLDAQAALPALLDLLADRRPDVVLREPAELGSITAAQACGVPHVAVAIGVNRAADFMGPLLRDPSVELDALAGLAVGTTWQAMVTEPTLTCVPPLLDEALGPLPADLRQADALFDRTQ